MGQNEKEEHGAGRHEKVYRYCLETNATLDLDIQFLVSHSLTLRLLMSYIYGAPSKARNANVVYIWTYVWQR